jgi:uncharacterized protein GlcG (DUF336 family)
MRRLISIAAGLAATILAGTAQADLPTQKVLTLDLALEAAQAAIADCRAKGFDTVVAVVLDRYGEEQVLLRSETAKVTRAQRVAIRKAYTALDTGAPSSTTMNAMAADPAVFARTAFINPNYTPQQGGLPIMVGKDVIGALAVAGTPGPSAADEGCATAGLAKIQDRLK